MSTKNCLKKERKPLVPLKTLDIVFRRRHVKNTQYYFTNRKHALKEDHGKASRPFRVPRTEKLLSYIKYSDRIEKNIFRNRLSQPLHLKDNVKIAATRDISRRLFIEEPPDDVRAVVEIHPEFYTVIEGRPLRSFDDIKVYVQNIQSYAMNRQQIGYRRDLIMKIDETLVDETREHDNIVRNLKSHIKNFQRFLTEDYKKACAKISAAEIAYNALVAKNNQFLVLVSSITKLNNILFKLDAIRSVLKIYRSFLIYVAPLEWRKEFDENLQMIANKSKSILFVTDTFKTDDEIAEAADIDKMVEQAKVELSSPLPPYLYFVKPEQMMHLFNTMELQSREYLLQLAKTGDPYKLLMRSIKTLKKVTKVELEYFQYYIDSINSQITREKLNEIHLQEKFYRILNEPFYHSVASPDTLKLKICIEFVYQEVFGKSDEDHENLKDPMKIMEVMYEDYNLKLDSLDFKIVNQARSDCFSQDLTMMRNAYKAERELRAFKEMTNAMHKAFLPPATYKRPVFKKFVDKKTRKAQALAEKRKAAALLMGEKRVAHTFKRITDEEREGLLLFTEWCEGTDPVPYLKTYYQYSKPALEWVPRHSLSEN
ncbi:uncharacterized protein LOC134668557 [Cydia fagiglandana]|uniref:uncharacterized protein LOC134668557 n=1 Tax=Cydia fagiglandana TaxID=1458189 RepID=UPI002FEE2EE8